MAQAKIMALVGKGGTGKTALSALMARQMIAAGLKHIMLIDADPAMGLALTLDADHARTTGDIREEIIERARGRDKQQKAQMAGIIDYMLLEALQERGPYSLLVMGRMDAKGCFCPVNALLREAIDDLAANYAYILIDGEAGIEQINREVIKRVDVLAVVTDASQRGLHTAKLIRDVVNKIEAMQPERLGVIINRVAKVDAEMVKRVEQTGLEFFGHVPDDRLVSEFDAAGRTLLELPDDCGAVSAMAPILRDLLALDG